MKWFNLQVAVLLLVLASVSCMPGGRIINGTSTDIHNYPFMVSLRDTTGFHLCGASIIAQRWILTAAHCTAGLKAENLNIQYASDELDPMTHNQIQVKRIIEHEQYDPPKYFANDIALLQLVGGGLLTNGKTIAAVKLADFETEQGLVGEPGVLIGWGVNVTGGYLQKKLQRVELKIYSDVECQKLYYNQTTNNQICSGVDEGGKGQCSGDSGGPLLTMENIQVGIVSWSIKPCTLPRLPGVFTKVAHYSDWIYKTINKYEMN